LLTLLFRGQNSLTIVALPKAALYSFYFNQSGRKNQEKMQEISHGSCNFYRKYRDILAKEENKRKKSFILFLRA